MGSPIRYYGMSRSLGMHNNTHGGSLGAGYWGRGAGGKHVAVDNTNKKGFFFFLNLDACSRHCLNLPSICARYGPLFPRDVF